jgi:predicted nucleic acid-binding protein
MYFDTTYLVRLYIDEPGSDALRRLAQTEPIACCILGRIEVYAAFHRKLREGAISEADYLASRVRFNRECALGGFTWLSFSEALIRRIDEAYETLPSNIFLRAADAAHLACASVNRFHEVYSNDRNLLAAASHFGLRGVNVLPAP